MYNYNYYRPYRSMASDATNTFFFLGLFIVFVLIFGGIGYALQSFFMMRIFKKAGLKPGLAWIPFYRNWKFYELGGYHGALSLIPLIASIPFIGWYFLSLPVFITTIVLTSLVAKEVSAKLGKPEISILVPLGAVSFGITFLVWWILISTTENEWQDSAGKPSLADGTILGYTVEEFEVEEETETEVPAKPAKKTKK